MIVHRDYTRTEHDDFILNVRLSPHEEAVPIYMDDGTLVAWKIQRVYE